MHGQAVERPLEHCPPTLATPEMLHGTCWHAGGSDGGGAGGEGGGEGGGGEGGGGEGGGGGTAALGTMSAAERR